MPRIYRAMAMAEDGKPVVAKSARGLGVREPGNPNPDVDVDDRKTVICNGKGMSVAEHWRFLPAHRLPKRLDDGVIGARGSDSMHCWRMGEGEFVAGPVAEGLELVLKTHAVSLGVVAPSSSMTLDEYQAKLASTRDAWTEDEE